MAGDRGRGGSRGRGLGRHGHNGGRPSRGGRRSGDQDDDAEVFSRSTFRTDERRRQREGDGDDDDFGGGRRPPRRDSFESVKDAMQRQIAEDPALHRMQRALDRKAARKQKKETDKRRRMSLHESWKGRKREEREERERQTAHRKSAKKAPVRPAKKKSSAGTTAAKTSGNGPSNDTSAGKPKSTTKVSGASRVNQPPVLAPATRSVADDHDHDHDHADDEALPLPPVAVRGSMSVLRRKGQAESMKSSGGVSLMGALSLEPRVVEAVRRYANKLAITHLSSQLRELIDFFTGGGMPRSQVLECFARDLCANCLGHSNLPSATAIAYAAVVRFLQLEIDVESTIPIVRRLFQEANRLISSVDEKKAAGAPTSGSVALQCTSAATFIGHLLLVKAIDTSVVVSTLQCLMGLETSEPILTAKRDGSKKKAASSETTTAITTLFTADSIAMAMRLVSVAGPTLRKVCPSELTSLLTGAQQLLEAEGRVPSNLVLRYQVLIDEIKGAALRKNSATNASGSLVDEASLAQALDAIATARALASADKVKGATGAQLLSRQRANQARLVEQHPSVALSWPSLLQHVDAIHDGHKLGRLEEPLPCHDGAAASRGQKSHSSQKSADVFNTDDSEAAKRNDKMEVRAKDKAVAGQRLATESRRRIFDAVVSSVDDVDAVQRLATLHHQSGGGGGRGASLHDIASLLVQCCVQEEKYNSFYAKVLERLCHGTKKFPHTMQFALWDRFKLIRSSNEVDFCSMLNLSSLIASLIEHRAISFSVLRGLDLDDIVEDEASAAEHEGDASQSRKKAHKTRAEKDAETVAALGRVPKALDLFVRVLLLRCLIVVPLKALCDFFFGGKLSSDDRGMDDVLDERAAKAAATATLRSALRLVLRWYFQNEAIAASWMPLMFDVVATASGTEVEDEQDEGRPQADGLQSVRELRRADMQSRDVSIPEGPEAKAYHLVNWLSKQAEDLPRRVKAVQRALKDGV